MTDYDSIECEHKDSLYDASGNLSLNLKDGETVERTDFQGEATFEEVTTDELLKIYQNGKETE